MLPRSITRKYQLQLGSWGEPGVTDSGGNRKRKVRTFTGFDKWSNWTILVPAGRHAHIYMCAVLRDDGGRTRKMCGELVQRSAEEICDVRGTGAAVRNSRGTACKHNNAGWIDTLGGDHGSQEEEVEAQSIVVGA